MDDTAANAPGAGAPGARERPAAWALGDAVTVRAFRLAGLAGRAVDTAEEARAAFAAARAAGVTLVIATERVATLLREVEPARATGGALLPIVVAVPGAADGPAAPGAGSAPARLARRVRQVLGLPPEPAAGPPAGGGDA